MVRGNRVMIFKCHTNRETSTNTYLTPVLPFPAYAFARIFQNDTVLRTVGIPNASSLQDGSFYVTVCDAGRDPNEISFLAHQHDLSADACALQKLVRASRIAQ